MKQADVDDFSIESSLIIISAELKSVVEARQEIGRRLKISPRKERQIILNEHREIKVVEYSLMEKVAELELLIAQSEGAEKEVERLKKKITRFKSRMRHSDWLVWTRSIWKFKEMESDAKTGRHPAQFSAVVPSRLIQMFSFIGDTVLDPFVGTGTTCIEAMKLSRDSIGIDINSEYVELSQTQIQLLDVKNSRKLSDNATAEVRAGDARDMKHIDDESVHLIVTHPPYWNCVKISDLEDDLSNCDNDSYDDFIQQMTDVLHECHRVLCEDRVAAFMIGDITRKVNGVTQQFPLHSDLIVAAKSVGFSLWDIYIVETKMRSSGGMPMMGSYPYPHKIFAQFAHNYLLVFRKS